MNLQIMKNYSQQGLYRSIEIFRFPLEYPSSTRLLGFRFLLQYRHREPTIAPTKDHILTQMKDMIDKYYEQNNNESSSVLMELVDMLLDYSKVDGEKLLAYLREKRNVANDKGPTQDGAECTIYGDSQSTHNKEISESTRKVASYLVTMFPLIIEKEEKNSHYETVKQSMVDMFGDNIKKVIDRIYIDNAHFNIGHTVDEIFMSLFVWIEHNKKRHKNFMHKEVLKRLGEELGEMENYCSSRLLAGLVNSIQGFTDDNNLQIRISEREQLKSVVFSHLNKTIQACDDEEILNGFIDKNKKFISFVKNEVSKNIHGWAKEYGKDTVKKFVPEIINEYSGKRMYE